MVFNKIKQIIRRFINTKKLYIYKETNDKWTKNYSRLIVSKTSYFDPYVCYKNKSLYVSNRDENTIEKYDIVESNLIYSLQNKKIVLKPRIGNWDAIINRACVLFVNDRYYMWYTGQEKMKSCIGLAISDDGVHFNHRIDCPVLCPSETYEKSNVMNPCVLYDDRNKKFEMWYLAGDFYEPDVVCYASSIDGISWKKNKKPVFEKSNNLYDKYKVGGCDIIRQNDEYLMYYIGYQNLDNARICKAISKDGIRWKRSDENPIISPSIGKYDAHACYKPAFYYDSLNNVELIFYNGRRKTLESILYAYKMKS